MKSLLITITILFAVNFSYAQWTGTSPGPIYYNGGNVGIGTSNPLGSLHIFNATPGQSLLALSRPSSEVVKALDVMVDANNNTVFTTANADLNFKTNFNGGSTLSTMYLNYLGNVGIGTTSPSTALQIGNFNSGSSNNQLVIPGTYNFEQVRLGQIGNGNSALEFVNHTDLSGAYGVKLLVDVDHGASGLQFQYASPTTSYSSLSYTTGLYMNLSGNVGIGTTTPDTKLAVNGTIHSKEVKVDLTGWSDYVFKLTYQLPKLSEIKSYIDLNQHLPDMPSATEVEKDGLNLGEMVKLQTKKIEELTLYLIEKDEKEKEQETTNKKLQQAIEILKTKLNQLTDHNQSSQK